MAMWRHLSSPNAAMTDFERALRIVLTHEGGYSNDKRDPGGETMYGITARVARENGYHGPMRELPLTIAKNIYRVRYWDAANCDEYPWPLCLYVFDSAVNQGPSAAVKMLQAALDTVQDGVAGPTTKRLAQASNDWHWGKFMAHRAMRYAKTDNFDAFGAGWLTRMFMVAREGA